MPKIIDGEHYLTQGYGFTAFAKSPAGKKLYKAWGGQHKGLDFGTHRKELPVISPVPGEVVRASMETGYGNHVEVLGADGWRRQFAHLSSFAVKVGDFVEVGQVVGRVGNTGASTAIHLHFGNRKATKTGYIYRDPSPDLEIEQIVVPAKPTKKFIKAEGASAVYIYRGDKKHPIPDWDTFVALVNLGTEASKEDKDPKEHIEELDEAIISKIPTGAIIPTL